MNYNTIDERKARILARLPQQYTHTQLIQKSKQLQQAAIETELQTPVLPRPATCAGAMVFPLESGRRYCMNCGGSHE